MVMGGGQKFHKILWIFMENLFIKSKKLARPLGLVETLTKTCSELS